MAVVLLVLLGVEREAHDQVALITKSVNTYADVEEFESSQTSTQSIAGSTTPSTPKDFTTQNNTQLAETAAHERVQVVKVVDGDTIDVLMQGVTERVRLIGIDTPESVKVGSPVECFAKEASAKTKQLLEGKMISMQKDVSERDKYGRLLRYVLLDGVFINRLLVREGYAQVLTYPPDVAYNGELLEAQQLARDEKLGLWSACENSLKSVPLSSELESTSSPGCQIKGNVSQATGEKIYHVPGCEYYAQTRISEDKGERWFCTEEEAKAHGWRKALNCGV